MHSQNRRSSKLLLFIPFVVLLTSCAAGNEQFTADTPAGFWYGLWHGVISFISLVVHLFNETVMVYERNNSGGWYDFGFLLGVIFVWGGGCHVRCKSAERKKRDKEWEEIGNKVELKVMRNLKNWADDEEGPGRDAVNRQEWDEVCKKVEKKIKRKLRDWAEKE